ncbi:copper resistance protein CopD [Actinokineospora fastidiosa]|uniref:Copper resistance protein CopD n=1 Tax=Actinokineospora fastidiosa TaxID=1816 RepID=A0A918G6R3_9PSEU|nr:copper resistance protein CopD [Actinokineospora fastidiosa]
MTGRVGWLVVLLGLAGLVGVAAGSAVTAVEPIPGLPDAGVVVRAGLPVARLLLDLAAVATVGLCLLPMLVGFDRPRNAEPTMALARRAAVAASVVWAVAAVVALVLQTAELRASADVSFGAVADYVATVGAGKALVFVACLALVSAVLCGLAVRKGDAVPAELRAAVALFALLPLPVTGHATGWRWHDVTMISMELHVMAAAAWTGGLGAVVVLLAANRSLLARAVPRFSRLATVCVLVVGLSGVFNAVIELAPRFDLFATGYGIVVLLKLGCLVALGALGAHIRFRLLPGIRSHRRTALVTWAGAELAVMGLAFGLAVVLTRVPAA